MRTYAKTCFKVFGVHENADKFISVQFQAEKHSTAYIINACFHSPVHSFCMIIVIVFRTCRVKSFITLFIISFLKQDICADTCIFELFIILVGGCGNIYIYTSDSTVFMLDTVNSFDTFKDILDRVINRVFTCFKCKTLMSHILQGNYFFFNFFLSQFLSCNMLVFKVIGAVKTAVYAVIRQVQRCEHNNSVAVVIFLNLLGKGIYLLIFFFNVAVKQHKGFLMGKTFFKSCLFTVKQNKGFFMGKTFFQSCFFKNLVDKLCIMLVFLSVFKTGFYFLVIDKFLCMR